MGQVFINGAYIGEGELTATVTSTEANRYQYGDSVRSDCYPYYISPFCIKKYREFTPDKIKDVKFYPPATKMIFTDGTVITSVAHDGDEFDEYTGMMICIMKYIFKDNRYNNMFRKWIKKAKDEEKEKAKEEKRAAEEKEIRERQRKKKAAKKLLKKEAKREEEIEIQKEAYLRAMKEKDEK